MEDTVLRVDVDQNLSQYLHQALTASRDELFVMLLAVPRLTSARKELLRQALGRRPNR